MKYALIFLVFIGLIASGWFGYTLLATPRVSVDNTQALTKTVGLTDEVKTLLAKKLLSLEEFAATPELVSEVEAANTKNVTLSTDQISQLDEAWQATEEVGPTIKPFLTNTTAVLLSEFQEENPGFVELFVTDSRGLNVGQTNKTSDYLQSDEEWWVNAYGKGVGKAYFGEIEYDDSSKSESIALYVPVYNQKQMVIGVLKAVMALTSIQNEL